MSSSNGINDVHVVVSDEEEANSAANGGHRLPRSLGESNLFLFGGGGLLRFALIIFFFTYFCIVSPIRKLVMLAKECSVSPSGR